MAIAIYIMKKQCKNKFLDKLSKLPLLHNYLVDLEKPPEELKELNTRIQKTKLNEYININDVLIFQSACLMLAILNVFILIILSNLRILNIPIGVTFLISGGFIIIGYIFRIFISFKAKKMASKVMNSIPIINNYILNMAKQDKLMSDILYRLTLINTPYKENFIIAYELYNKNADDTFYYLSKVFSDNYIKESFKILKKSDEYDKKTLIDSLSKINNIIVRAYRNELKIKADKTLITNELSMIVPFTFLAILVVIPVTETVINEMKTLSHIGQN